MHSILILGAGRVGGSLARQLVLEGAGNYGVTVVDVDESRLSPLRQLDIRCVPGWPADPGVLRQAGAEDADCLVAVTDNDEVNVVACHLVMVMDGAPRRIVRVHGDVGGVLESMGGNGADPKAFTAAINPAREVASHLQSLLLHPGATLAIRLADGAASMLAAKAAPGGILVGRTLSDLHLLFPSVGVRAAALVRNGGCQFPEASTVIQEGDEILMIALERDIPVLLRGLRPQEAPIRSIVIGGGGEVGSTLALSMDGSRKVKILESDDARCGALAAASHSALVLQCDATDPDILEGCLEGCDAYCAAMDDDADNILSAMMAKQLQVRESIAVIENRSYSRVLGEAHTHFDAVVSPLDVVVSAFMGHLLQVEQAQRILDGAADVVEAEMQASDVAGLPNQLLGLPIEDLGMPSGTSLAAVVRGGRVLQHLRGESLRVGDHVVIIVSDRRRLDVIHERFASAPSAPKSAGASILARAGAALRRWLPGASAHGPVRP